MSRYTNHFSNPWNLSKTHYPPGKRPALGKDVDAFTRDWSEAFQHKDMQRNYTIEDHELRKSRALLKKAVRGELLAPGLQKVYDSRISKVTDREKILTACKNTLSRAVDSRKDITVEDMERRKQFRDVLMSVFPELGERLFRVEVDIQEDLARLTRENDDLKDEKQTLEVQNGQLQQLIDTVAGAEDVVKKMQDLIQTSNLPQVGAQGELGDLRAKVRAFKVKETEWDDKVRKKDAESEFKRVAFEGRLDKINRDIEAVRNERDDFRDSYRESELAGLESKRLQDIAERHRKLTEHQLQLQDVRLRESSTKIKEMAAELEKVTKAHDSLLTHMQNIQQAYDALRREPDLHRSPSRRRSNASQISVGAALQTLRMNSPYVSPYGPLRPEQSPYGRPPRERSPHGRSPRERSSYEPSPRERSPHGHRMLPPQYPSMDQTLSSQFGGPLEPSRPSLSPSQSQEYLRQEQRPGSSSFARSSGHPSTIEIFPPHAVLSASPSTFGTSPGLGNMGGAPAPPSTAGTISRPYAFLESGLVATGPRSLNVPPGLIAKMDAQIAEWESSPGKTSWSAVTRASGRRCVQTRRINLNQQKVPIPSDENGTVACHRCVGKRLLCVLVDERGAVILPMPVEERSGFAGPMNGGYFVKI
jgi:hypothetical protein